MDNMAMCVWMQSHSFDGLIDDMRSGREAAYRAGYEAHATTFNKYDRDRAHKAGRKQGYVKGFNEGQANKAEAVKAEHEKTVADMDAGYRQWQTRHKGCEGFSYEYVRKGMDAKYRLRRTPPPAKVVVEMDRNDYETMGAAGSVWFATMTLVDPQPETNEKEKA